MAIEEILKEIEDLLYDASRVPLTNKIILEEDDMLRLFQELKDMLPNEVVEAKRIINERDRVLSEAQNEAQKIVEQAKSYISKLTDENVITKQAQEQANEIVKAANKNANDLHNDAINYAGEVFKHLEANLERALEVVRTGHNELSQSKK